MRFTLLQLHVVTRYCDRKTFYSYVKPQRVVASCSGAIQLVNHHSCGLLQVQLLCWSELIATSHLWWWRWWKFMSWCCSVSFSCRLLLYRLPSVS